jgi:hypothetical protein
MNAVMDHEKAQAAPETHAAPVARSTITAWSPRRSALIAGAALALMAVVSAFGVFGALAPLITAGDADKTARAILDSELLFRSGIASLVVVVILDIVAATALFRLFEPVNRSVSAMAALFRITYSAVFLIAILQLSVAVTLLGEPELAMRAIEAFYTIWYAGLVLFGIHLLLIGYLAYRSAFMPKIFGILVALAGLGYLADGFGIVMVPGFSTTFGMFTFGGEVALFVWLLIKGRRLPIR